MAHCRYCGKEIDKDTAYRYSERIYYCNKECLSKKVNAKFKPQKGSEKREFTDYIQQIYINNGYSKYAIPWTLIMSQTKNILEDHEVWHYGTLKYILWYMYEILELNMFSEKGSILNLLPYYAQEAEEYFCHENDIKNETENFEFEENKIVKMYTQNKPKFNKIDLTNL